MSYCRFASDDWKSDVYVYADVSGGYTTHVAGARHVPGVELPPPIEFGEDGWAERVVAVFDIIRDADLVGIDLPHAGETFNHATPGECANHLLSLRELGYHVPDDALEELRKDELCRDTSS